MIAAGEGDVDESLLTGEPKPVPRRAGDAVKAGTVNLDGSSRSSLRRWAKPRWRVKSAGFYTKPCGRALRSNAWWINSRRG
ncbi:MAG: hypothetical protein HND47_07960 [Chloroflexi bacterium]|nr:hypothetical protein [Chloroflexota bacterium]